MDRLIEIHSLIYLESTYTNKKNLDKKLYKISNRVFRPNSITFYS